MDDRLRRMAMVRKTAGHIDGDPTVHPSMQYADDASHGGGVFSTGTGIPGPQFTGSIAGASSISVNWQTPVPGASSYSIYRSTVAGTKGASIKTGQLTSPYTDSAGLSHGTTYYYQVTAIVSGGTETNPSPQTSVLFT